MMSKINALSHQNELIFTDHPYTIINWDRMAGATTGMFLKWICSQQSVLMVDERDVRFYTCCYFLKELGLEFNVGGDRVYGYRRIILKDTLLSIDFYNYKSFLETIHYLRPNQTLWLIDNVDMYFNDREVESIINRLNYKQQIVFSCDRNNLGWRHLEYNRGEAVFDDKGNLVVMEYSWDRCLIDWKHNDLKRHFATKVGEEFYKMGVRVL